MGWFGGSDDVTTTSNTSNLNEDERVIQEDDGVLFQSRDSSNFSIIDEFPDTVQEFSSDVLGFAEVAQETSFNLLETVIATLKDNTNAIGKQAQSTVSQALSTVENIKSQEQSGSIELLRQSVPYLVVGLVAYLLLKK